jgi:hypothetical protein
MNLEILTNADDDPTFVELLRHLIGQLVGEEFPEQIFVMKIDNWFDHKWLNFSGIGSVRFDDFRLEIDTARSMNSARTRSHSLRSLRIV